MHKASLGFPIEIGHTSVTTNKPSGKCVDRLDLYQSLLWLQRYVVYVVGVIARVSEASTCLFLTFLIGVNDSVVDLGSPTPPLLRTSHVHYLPLQPQYISELQLN